MGGKDEAPKGPDWKKLISQMEKYASTNRDIFTKAMSFGEGQFTKMDEWAKRITDFGISLSGKLGDAANKFDATTGKRISELDKFGTEFGKAAGAEFERGTSLADKLLGTMMPGLEAGGEAGTAALESYRKQGIPFQDKYINKLANWDTAGRREERAARAVSDIALTTEAARESELRRLESYGIDPSQTRAASLDSRLQAQAAVAKAGAANEGRLQVEGEGLALGKTAADMYSERGKLGGALTESATRQGAIASDVGAAPGLAYLQQLGALGNYGLGVSQLEQGAGQAGFNMRALAGGVGTQALLAGANQGNLAASYGSGVYGQGTDINRTGAGIINQGYSTGGDLNRNDLIGHQMNQQNSFWGGLGQLAGAVGPAIMGGPIGAAIGSGIMGGIQGFSGLASPSGSLPQALPVSGNWQGYQYNEGGAIPESASPSRGARPDDVPVKATAGEYIVDADTVEWFGKKHFRDLKEKAKKQRAGIPAAA